MGSTSAIRQGLALAVALCLLAAARAQIQPVRRQGPPGPFQGGPVQPGPFQGGPVQPGPVQGGPVQPGQFQNGQFQNGQVTLPPYYNPSGFNPYNPYLVQRNPNQFQPTQQNFNRFTCSQTDGSAAAVEQCINAVRENPGFFQQAARCDLTKLTPAPPLNTDFSLRQVAIDHVRDMANRHRLTHDGYSRRISATGFQGGTYTNENVAFTDGSSALHTVMRWMCHPRDAQHIMDCGFQWIGSAVLCPFGNSSLGCFYSVDFGGDGNKQCPRRVCGPFGNNCYYAPAAPPPAPVD